jgi:hypothetical protein
MNQPQAEFLDLYRAGLKNAVDLMKSSLENAERLQSQQMSALRSALDQHLRSVNDLTEAKSMDDLLELQQKMAGAQLERVMDYWSVMCKTAGENQMAAATQVQKQMAQARDWFNETYAMTARATEEAAKLATAQVASANAGMRQPRQERKSA